MSPGIPAAPAPTAWTITWETADAKELMAGAPDPAHGPAVRFASLRRRPALIIGSAQRQPHPGPAPNVDVVRRRSGGGGVWLAPGAQVWADVALPREHAEWSDDVGRAVWWLGHTWAQALRSLGMSDLHVHMGAMIHAPCDNNVCFAGVGPGEVTVGPAPNPKVVGISQRRTRAGALFQCAVPLAWDPAPIAAAVGIADPAPLQRAAAVAPYEQQAVEDAFAEALLARGAGAPTA